MRRSAPPAARRRFLQQQLVAQTASTCRALLAPSSRRARCAPCCPCRARAACVLSDRCPPDSTRSARSRAGRRRTAIPATRDPAAGTARPLDARRSCRWQGTRRSAATFPRLARRTSASPALPSPPADSKSRSSLPPTAPTGCASAISAWAPAAPDFPSAMPSRTQYLKNDRSAASFRAIELFSSP